MLELFAAWREIVHISEWTGLSLGALAALAALAYFVRIPLPTVIRAVVLIVAVYFSLITGETFGARDKQRQWDASRAAAAEASRKHDAEVTEQLAQKYNPELEQIQKQAQTNKDLADGYEKKIMALMAKKSATGACQLGDMAGRLHLKR